MSPSFRPILGRAMISRSAAVVFRKRNARVESPVPAPAPRGLEARALAVEAAHEAVRE